LDNHREKVAVYQTLTICCFVGYNHEDCILGKTPTNAGKTINPAPISYSTGYQYQLK